MTEPKTLISDVSLAIEGNQKSCKDIYDYLAPIIRKTIKRKIFGIQSHLVHDILQDVFVKLFLNLRSYKPGNSFTSWAISIAVHHVIDLSRKRKPEIEFCESIESNANGFPEMINESYHESIDPRYDIFDLSNQHLDENSNGIILEKYYLGLKQKEIAAKMNKPIGSISGIQANAINQLRNKIQALRLVRSNFF